MQIRYSFIDLAQIVCKLPETRIEHAYVSSSDEDYDGYISEPSNLVIYSQMSFCIDQEENANGFRVSHRIEVRKFASNELEALCRCPKMSLTRTKWNCRWRWNRTKHKNWPACCSRSEIPRKCSKASIPTNERQRCRSPTANDTRQMY